MLLTAAPVTAQILFDDVSATAGIAGTGSETWGAAWGELNGDIYPDLYTSNHRTPGQLLQNNGDGTFSDRSVEADLSAAFYDSTKDKHGAIWADLDGDGDQDLLTTVSALESPILINDAGILTDKRSALGLTLGNDNGSRMPIVLDLTTTGGSTSSWSAYARNTQPRQCSGNNQTARSPSCRTQRASAA